jgi:hypothetical protein
VSPHLYIAEAVFIQFFTHWDDDLPFLSFHDKCEVKALPHEVSLLPC